MADPAGGVTVAIPVRDGGELFVDLLDVLASQSVSHEVLVCDSGSHDGSVDRARERGARVITIPPEQFGHGRTRNLLVAEARGAHVALLSQDAIPADDHWLERILSAFSLAPDVGLAYGPYIPRRDAPAPVRIELTSWFSSLAPDGAPRLDRLAPIEKADSSTDIVADLVGRRGFFTDANACLSRQAWERVPFRDLGYAEDRALALDMLRAGYAKVFIPDAAVVHSHAYRPAQQLRRCFDEWRGLLDVYGWREPFDVVRAAAQVRGDLGRARRQIDGEASPSDRIVTLAAVGTHRLLCLAGALLGSRADHLPRWLERRLSLERRAASAPTRRTSASHG